LEAAALLKERTDIKFRVLGGGYLLEPALRMIAEKKLDNVELLSKYLSDDLLRAAMCDAAISLGQFDKNERLSRTIPHKAFESMAMGIPYLSGDAPGIKEICVDGETCFFVPLADPQALAAKIVELSRNPGLLAQVGENGKREFAKRFSNAALGAQLARIITTYKG
jgi:glycosyltransferase involved in cell wall biosynthesis